MAALTAFRVALLHPRPGTGGGGTTDAQHAANLQAMRPYIYQPGQAAIDRAVALLVP